MPRLFFKSLYWKISAVFLLLLLLLGIAFNFITLFSTEMYFQEGNQRLHRRFASFVADLLQSYSSTSLDQGEIQKVFEQVNKMNPSVEVYLIDEQGTILYSSTPFENLKLHQIDIQPIKKFLAVEGKQFTMGEDPKGIHKEKVFTAAPFVFHEKKGGYVYVILGGEEYDSALQFIQQNYILRLGVKTLIISLIAAAIIGLLSIGFLTRRLYRLTKAMTEFSIGNFSQRVCNVSDDEIGTAARTFNQMAEMIQRHVDELAAIDSLRRELIANVSHDLRTPLSSMQGYVETVILKDASLTTSERQKYLQTILESTIKLNALVQELFELSKLDARQTLPKPESFSLSELVQDVAQKFHLRAEKNNIQIDTSLPNDLPFVRADIGMIDRVLQNLIENAINYTAANGRITLHVARVEDKLRVDIADTGCGIPARDLASVFDRFYRARSNRSANDGTGLGLAIVKKILTLHGEDIHVESREHVGTRFYFTLPLS